MSIRETPGKAYPETLSWEQEARTDPLFGVMSVESSLQLVADIPLRALTDVVDRLVDGA